MTDWIALSRLEGFFHVARTGGYARAARAFPYPISQPGVHQQVRKLEEELGVRLFVRAAKDRMALTAEGRALDDFIRPFFERLPGVVRGLRQKTFGGTLTMHAGGLLIRKLLPAWLRRLAKARPDVVVDLHEAEEPALALLRRGETDLVVDFLPVVPPDVAAREIASTHGFVVIPASHALAKRARWPLADLAALTFVSYPPSSAPFRLQMAFLDEQGVAPARTLSVGSADAILGFVEAGVGWSIVPWLDPAGPKSPDLAAQRVAGPRGRFPVHAAWRKSDSASPLITAALAAATAG